MSFRIETKIINGESRFITISNKGNIICNAFGYGFKTRWKAYCGTIRLMKYKNKL